MRQEATLDITKDLSPGLAAGLFQPGASYTAVVRFSNGSPGATSSDAKGDTRGMAIKIFGVKGPKLLNDPLNPEIQDIILISSPYFFIDSAENYTRFFEAVDSGNIRQFALIPWYLGIKGSWHAFNMLRQTIANPLETRYWSVVPYQLGLGDARQAAKYSA